MSAHFQEIDRRPTRMGELVLRRRLEPSVKVDVYEVKLGDAFLMSSLFTVAEIELANLALAALKGDELDIVVGGLGLGYTARAGLESRRVRSLTVVEVLRPVIDWHERDLLPLATEITSDPRCHLVEGDFFAMIDQGWGFGFDGPDRYHAVLVDIDHSPRHLLAPSHASFYTPRGLTLVADRLHPGGVLALWSDGAPDADFAATLETEFASCDTHVITFPNPLIDGESASTVYVARVREV